MERLNKRIAESGLCSRRKAEEYISLGLVAVNGEVVTELGTKVDDDDEIKVNGKILHKENKYYYAINKPRGVLCTVSDPKKRKTIIDILPKQVREERIFPCGRLDYDTKGIVILTNDGDFMNEIVGPRSGVEKEYRARITGLLKNDELRKLCKGVMIQGKMTLPSMTWIESFDREHDSTLVRIIITDGKYHQVKEMFKAVGHEVKKLTRVR